ncbi:DNA translocase FtsK [Bacillus sp. BHET2]|uniref:DNA translocase FtsK n=1 Tax=Bacillus sp. BHET2 TaxID=2583818 RepID=UPI00110D5EBB|nr:DNA translocase FtsK [Bacillus sp. BHET2]TMU86056.1 DNA translocase FtsK [Bacillus sp. BHET2]
MFVSWIKKIFGKLSDNDEQFEEYYDEKQDDVQSTNKKKIERKNIPGPAHSRDVEARMTYQYPKGNFRFPIISDGENRERPRASRNRRTEEKEEPVKEQKVPKRNYNSNNRKTKEDNPSPSVKPKKTPKVEKGNSRPFTPTEIPSPIYGFKGRPVKKEESVEYELKKFLHKDEENAEPRVVHQEPAKEEKLIPSNEEVLSMDVTAVQRSNESHMEEIKDAASKIEDETEASIEPPKMQQPLTPEVETKSTEETTFMEEKDETDMDAEETLRRSSERISLITEIAQAVEETDDSGRDLESHEAEGSVESDSTQEVVQSVQESQVQDTQTTHQEEPIEESLIEEAPLLEESPVEEDPETTISQQEVIGDEPETTVSRQEVKEEDPETTVSQQQDKEEEPPRRKRSHLPFNVLMLKQDKRQMNASKPPVRATKESVEQEVDEIKTESRSAVLPVQEEKQDTVEETVSLQPTDEKKDHQSPVQGEEAAKSYDELSSSTKRTRDYVFPEVDYLMPPVSKEMSEEWLDSQRILLDETLHNFNVRAKVVNVTQGPSVTRFEVQPEPGVKVNKITNLSDDIKLSLAAKDIRMEAPIPGKHTIGIEVPNRESRPVCISEVIASPAFQEPTSPLTAALGLDISGQPIVTDLSKMPHGLIAGATGSGKSVCINSILVSLLYKASPDELKMLLIDPKMVELAPYNRIPHLVSPVITDVKAATAALKWAVEEMERRYELFAHTGVRDIKRFNELAKRNKQYSDMLPYLVIVIDELADLMMMSPADVEEAICRIAQKARACGIHLIIATQRPSVDVITGLIKANVPTRVAFSVSSSVDSRTIIDGSGAERLLGKGDMLFLENGSSKPVRLQGTFVSDDEIDDIINHVREQREPDYLFQQDELIKKAQVTEEEDELFLEACEFVVDQGGASASSLQRRFRIGYNRAARLMEMMESNGIISESRGSKPRDVLISESELETLA